jgi:beta-galactosidase
MRRALLATLVLLAARPAAAAFPAKFLWGTAIAGFQADMGGNPAHRDQNTDWWAWAHDAANIAAHRVSGDLPEAGPAFYDHYKEDVRRARLGLRSNTLRLSLEWSRIFPTSTASVDTSGGITLAALQQLDTLASQAEVTHYRAVFTELRRRHLAPFVTLSHFSLPLWIHDPIAARNALAGIDPSGALPTGFGPAGWLDAAIVPEFGKYAAYCAWKFGDLVDLWAPLNEPLVVAVSGYVNVPGAFAGNFPPGAFSFTGTIAVLVNEVAANAAAYDAVKAWDTVDADGDGVAARVGLVHNMVAFQPKNPQSAGDVAGAMHGDYLFNRIFLNAALLGDVDANANGTIDAGEHHPELVGKADFVGVNYYLRATASSLGAPISPVIPLLDFLPTLSYQTPQNPSAPPCPSTCTEFGWEIYPAGLRDVLTIAGSYGLPVYITENGIADGNDDQRPAYLIRHLQVLQQAIADGVANVRGYYHWSLVDNFEWSSGYYPKFGLYAFDTKKRLRRRPSAVYYGRIARKNVIPSRLAARFGS